MKNRLIVTGLAILACASIVLAETDPKARDEIRSIRNGDNNDDQIRTLRVSGSGTVGGALTVTGASTLNGGLTVVGAITGTTIDATKISGNIPKAAQTNVLRGVIRSGVCTNGQAISFVPAMAQTPTVVGHYIGTIASLATNALGDYPILTLSSVTANGFTFASSVNQTNAIYYMATDL